MFSYFKTNLATGFKTSPLHRTMLSISLFILFAVFAMATGFSTGLLKFASLESDLIYILPLTLFIFPSLFEETVFRGLLIPNDTVLKGSKEILKRSLFSSIIFVIWHPFNALTINPGAKNFFLDPWFLLIVFVLGMICSLGYIFSRSLWVPTIMHWLTVLFWVLFLGGRNLVLQ